MDRRTFIAGVSGVAVAATAGCSASAAPRPPDVPTDDLDAGGWERVEQETEEVFAEEFAGQQITATASTEVYENAALREELAEKTLGQVSEAPVTFFASRITFDPDLTSLPGGVGRDLLVDEVEAQSVATLETQMRNGGVEDVATVAEGSLTVDTGETASRTDLRGVIRFDSVSFPVTDGETVEVDGDELPVAGRLAVWSGEESVLVAGGAFPAENVDERLEEDLSSAISVTVEVDLGLEPDAYEAELLDLIAAVE